MSRILLSVRRRLLTIVTAIAALAIITTIYINPSFTHPASAHLGSSVLGPGAKPNVGGALEELEDKEDGAKPVPYNIDYDLHEIKIGNISDTHYLVKSISGEDGKYVTLDFLGHTGLNPSIIPHPYIKNHYMMVAQRDKDERTFSPFFAEMWCEAIWNGKTLRCNESTSILPITFSESNNCDGKKDGMLAMLNMNIGPHDARVFMGPKSAPYIMYGSQSDHDDMCFGQWLQDLRLLVEWGPFIDKKIPFAHAVSIRRPPPHRPVEKNYFIFWGPDEEMYAHYDLEPRRSFSRIDANGQHSGNLARKARATDDPCWERFAQETAFSNGTHQATNSLSVTMCNRADPTCKPTAANTKIFTIFQKKLSYAGHAYYLPYVMIFDSTPPFAMQSLSAKPFWIHGQRAGGEPMKPEEMRTVHGMIDYAAYQHEMIYITSINWKVQELDYHGYMDDVLWLAFGREDTWMAAIDVTPEMLFGDMDQMIHCQAA